MKLSKFYSFALFLSPLSSSTPFHYSIILSFHNYLIAFLHYFHYFHSSILSSFSFLNIPIIFIPLLHYFVPPLFSFVILFLHHFPFLFSLFSFLQYFHYFHCSLSFIISFLHYFPSLSKFLSFVIFLPSLFPVIILKSSLFFLRHYFSITIVFSISLIIFILLLFSLLSFLIFIHFFFHSFITFQSWRDESFSIFRSYVDCFSKWICLILRRKSFCLDFFLFTLSTPLANPFYCIEFSHHWSLQTCVLLPNYFITDNTLLITPAV